MSDMAIIVELPEVIKNLWTAQQAIAGHYANTGLK